MTGATGEGYGGGRPGERPGCGALPLACCLSLDKADSPFLAAKALHSPFPHCRWCWTAPAHQPRLAWSAETTGCGHGRPHLCLRLSSKLPPGQDD